RGLRQPGPRAQRRIPVRSRASARSSIVMPAVVPVMPAMRARPALPSPTASKLAFLLRRPILGAASMAEGRATRAADVHDREALDARRAESDAADHALVVKAQAGDRRALGELLHKHGP